jgi:hypothetical protein
MKRLAWVGTESREPWSLQKMWLASLFMASSALACGDGSALELEEAPRGPATQLSELDDDANSEGYGGAVGVLAEVHIDPFTISFLAVGKPPDATISVAVGNTCPLAFPCDQPDPVSLLREKYAPSVGALTHLELFQALAPGVEPPAALVASHPLEAFDAGRNDDRVRPIEPVVPRLLGSEHALLPIRTLAELSVDGATYGFRAAGAGPDAIVFVTQTGAGDGLSALTRLAIVHGDLTLLETFLSLAPDEEPPQALVATHLREIDRIRSRTDDAIRYDLTLPPAHGWGGK